MYLIKYIFYEKYKGDSNSALQYILHKKDKKNHLSEPNLLEQLMMVSDHLDVAFVSLAHIGRSTWHSV